MKTEFVDVSPTRKEIKIEIDPADRAPSLRSHQRSLCEAGERAWLSSRTRAARGRAQLASRMRSAPRRCRNWFLRQSTTRSKSTRSNAIGEPDVQLDNAEALEKFGEEPLSVKVNVEVLPKVELQNYKGIEVARKTRPVTDENVTEMIEALRETRRRCNRSKIAAPSSATRSRLI